MPDLRMNTTRGYLTELHVARAVGAEHQLGEAITVATASSSRLR